MNGIEEIPESTFPNNLKLIQQYQRAEPIIMANYRDGTYHKGYFFGVSNNDINLITREDNIVIPPKIRSYVLHWYHTYILHTGMDRMDAMIFQHLYWPGIRYAVWKEVTNCDTCQRTK